MKRVLFAAFVLLVLLAGASALPLQEPDEGRYASIAQHVLRSGDLTRLELDGIAYYEKPPLFFWLGGLAMRLLGETELAARLPSVLASFFTVLLVARWGERSLGEGAGLVAGLVLLTTPLFGFFAPVAIVDPLLLLCITASLRCAWSVLGRGDGEAPARSAVTGFWIAVGVASLVKGPIGVVLPVATTVTYVLIVRDVAAFKAFARPDGWLLGALVSVPWFALAGRRDPTFLREFFLSQNLGRLTNGAKFERDHPIYYYVPIVLGTFVPWSLFLPEILGRVKDALRSRGALLAPARRLQLFLACAAVIPFAILSLAHSKLPYYLLPVTPAVALLVASVLCPKKDVEVKDGPAEKKSPGRWRFVAFGVIALAAAGFTLAARSMGPERLLHFMRGSTDASLHGTGWRQDLYHIESVQTLLPFLAGLLVAIGASSLAASVLAARGSTRRGALLVASTMALAFATARLFAAPAATSFSARPVHELIAKHRRPGEPVLCFLVFQRGLVFYSGDGRILLYDARYDEFGHDLLPKEAEGIAFQHDDERVRRFLASEKSVLVVVDSPHHVEILKTFCASPFVELGSVGPTTLVRTTGS